MFRDDDAVTADDPVVDAVHGVILEDAQERGGQVGARLA